VRRVFSAGAAASARKRAYYLSVPIIVQLDAMLARRKMSLTELSQRVGITLANLSVLKSGKAKAVRFSTLAEICRVLDCQPGDLLAYAPEAP
jgi:putative transcriptional regulator